MPRLTVQCQNDGCAERHVAEYSHEGRYHEGPIYIAYCAVSGVDLADYYTAEVVDGLDDDYEFVCIRSIRCEADEHGHDCHRANDAARREFYVGLLDEAPGYAAPVRVVR